MKVFVSWSGPVSKHIAEQMREWLKAVIQTLDPWLSSEDIDKGARWSPAIQKELSESRAAVFCVTPDSLESTWLNFEAGAVSNTDWSSRVCTYLFGMTRSSVTGPLAQFQHTLANEKDTWRLVKTLNLAQDGNALSEKLLEKSFRTYWPELEAALTALENVKRPNEVKRTTQDMVEETLNLVRDLQRMTLTANAESYAQIKALAAIQRETLAKELQFARAQSSERDLDQQIRELKAFLRGEIAKPQKPDTSKK